MEKTRFVVLVETRTQRARATSDAELSLEMSYYEWVLVADGGARSPQPTVLLLRFFPADRVVVGMLSQVHARDRDHIRNKLPPIILDQFTTLLSGPFCNFHKKKCNTHGNECDKLNSLNQVNVKVICDL
jgi:hypothetical protein